MFFSAISVVFSLFNITHFAIIIVQHAIRFRPDILNSTLPPPKLPPFSAFQRVVCSAQLGSSHQNSL